MGNHTATRARGRSSAAGGGSGARAAAGGDAVAALHERAARLQREQGLAREVRPGDGLQVRQAVPEWDPNPALPPNASHLLRLYGEDQFGAAISRYPYQKLVNTAKAAGVPGPYPRSQPELASRIAAHVTEGRYSANFGTRGTRAAPMATTTRPTSTGTPTPREREAESRAKAAESRATAAERRAAQLERQLATLQAQHDALKARVEGERAARTASRADRAASKRAAEEERRRNAPVIRNPEALRGYNPTERTNPYQLDAAYGHDQIRQVLSSLAIRSLREAVSVIQQHNPDAKPNDGGSTQGLIDFITEQVAPGY